MQNIFGVMRAPHSILFGVGQRHAIGKVVSAIGRRALVCTDQRFAASREMNEIMASLRQQEIETQVFDGTQAE